MMRMPLCRSGQGVLIAVSPFVEWSNRENAIRGTERAFIKSMLPLAQSLNNCHLRQVVVKRCPTSESAHRTIIAVLDQNHSKTYTTHRVPALSFQRNSYYASHGWCVRIPLYGCDSRSQAADVP